ncbi:iron complex transport system substrate-binding protein [Lishizhenia tianjinensis]|uniref:Iron complex transport system substrate-binding protein n=1 Tax=Lishizhenia tianjinensis TaxID=477690 RepID=A0A1I6Y318_9FLAO|nr:ABC transporter substrate-binding protein [Lishizhenia tianjinensis]SFT44908.1 iron complex transport system substrate-binding protein [Lishizhenia tianjinensis]
MKKIITLCSLALLFACSTDNRSEEISNTNAEQLSSEVEQQEQRIISLNGTATEILLGLGIKQELVGVDVTSANYSQAQNLGHTSRMAVEPILNLNPTLLIYKTGELNAQLIQQLQEMKVELLELKPEYTVNSVNAIVDQIANAVGKQEEATALKLEENFAHRFQLEKAPKVVFIYARGPGAMQMAGAGTAETKIIQMAGGVNPFDFEQYRPVTAEALVKANPDFVLMYNSGFKSLEQANGLKAIPGIMETTAGKNNALITMDANILHNFSISLPKAVEELHNAIQ